MTEAATRHLDDLVAAARLFRRQAGRIGRWADHLAGVLGAGGRLLVAGNGGSAAEAQHLTAELVGRFQSERQPLSAIPLHTDTSSLTAIGNDYGADEVFARQVRAHGRSGDVLVVMSTSGRSRNILAAARAARQLALTTWAFTGPLPNPLARACHDALGVQAADPATVQEIHLVAVHMLCAALDRVLDTGRSHPTEQEVVV